MQQHPTAGSWLQDMTACREFGEQLVEQNNSNPPVSLAEVEVEANVGQEQYTSVDIDGEAMKWLANLAWSHVLCAFAAFFDVETRW